MMWRLRDFLTWEMILLASVSSLNLFLKYSSLLWVGEPSHLCHHANTLSRDLIGCPRACGYPDAGGGKQVAPDEVCQQHVHRGRRCDISPDLVLLEVQRKSTLIQTIQDEDHLEPVGSADSCFFGFNKEVMKKSHQAELFPFQYIQLSEP